tara:strand:+ start:427 stop:969 length:543 start_codon:yes stop_codon:yes gene_type:complete
MVDIFWATAVLVGISLLQIAYQYFAKGKISTKTWVFYVIALFLGGMTIIFQDEQYIMWKTTAIYGLLAAALVISRFIFNKNLVKTALLGMLKTAAEKQGEKELKIDVPKPVYEKLNTIWFVFLISIAALNLYVAYNFSLDFWVNFKVFGLAIATFIAVLLTIFQVFKYLPDGFQEQANKK